MWTGPAVRIEHRIPKEVLGSCFGGGRPVWRPRNRCSSGFRTGRKAAARYKGEWRKTVGEAKARKQAKAPYKKKKKKVCPLSFIV
jgi:hypothetical protein